MEYVFVIVAIVGLCIVVVRAICKQATFMYEKYKHHGEGLVWVRSDLKGLHRDFCLCFDCKRFHPGSTGNCPIAHAIYENCIRHNVVTPIWECPRFAQEPGRDALIS